MAVEGRTHRPVVDHERCASCSICRGGCPAERIQEMRAEPDSLRGRIYEGVHGPLFQGRDLPSPRTACQDACPLGQDVAEYVALVSRRCPAEALDRILRTNPLPTVCGHVCTRPCEAACLRNRLDGPVPIRALKAFAALRGRENERPIQTTAHGRPVVAVVGSGPAGLTAAHDLALEGIPVLLLESHERPGGMAAWAIPGFRLPREALETDIRRILARGVDLRTGVRFGTDITLDDLRREGIRSVILATGTMKSLPLGIPGEETTGVMDCLGFLRDFNQGIQAEIGNHVLVVGGGNAAMDAARAARKAGANRVTVVYRRGRGEMPADIDEIRDAEREGVSFRFLTAPAHVIPSRTQGVSGLVCTKTERVDMGHGGRPRPVPIPGTEHEIHGDMVISAVGQCADPDPLLQGLGGKNARGFSLAPQSEPLGTGVEGVFAAGDVLNGPTSVVEAMASGRRAARAVVAALSREDGN